MGNKKKYLPASIIILFITLISALTIFMHYFHKVEVDLESIDSNVTSMLRYMGFDGCSLNDLGEYVGIPYTKSENTITDISIQEYISTVLKEYDEKVIITDRNVVEHGDIAVIDYTLSYEENEIKSVKDEIINIGSGHYDFQFENLLVGKKIGENFQFDWLVPNDKRIYGTFQELANKYIHVNGFIQYAYYIKPCEFSDDFIQQEFGFSNVAAYYKHIKDILESEAKIMSMTEEKASLINHIMKESTFILDEEAVVANAVKIYYEYRSSASAFGMKLSEYTYEVMNMTEDELYLQCYTESEDQIKLYLIVGAIAQNAGLVVTEAEIADFLDSKGYNSEIGDEDICYITYNLLQEKVLDYIYGLAICER